MVRTKVVDPPVGEDEVRVYSGTGAMEKERTASTCILYGWEQTIDVQQLFKFFERVAVERSIALAATETKRRSESQFRKPRFNTLKTKLLSGEWNDIEDVALYPSHEKFEGKGYSEIALVARLSGAKALVIAIDKSSASRNGCAFMDTVREAIVLAKPTYGLVAEIPHRMSPILYSAGIIRNPPTPETRQRVGDFGESYTHSNEHLKGKLRDVYEVNILSQVHLERDVSGRPLVKWLEERQLGKLERATDTTWVWSLNDKELQTVRVELLRAGALIVTI